MNDYKGLIKDLHICTSGDCFGCTLRTNKVNCKDLLLASVEGVIEQLVKERDAAVKDMNTLCSTFADICSFCKNDSRNDGDVCVKCKGTDWLEFWEWRGVQEDNT